MGAVSFTFSAISSPYFALSVKGGLPHFLTVSKVLAGVSATPFLIYPSGITQHTPKISSYSLYNNTNPKVKWKLKSHLALYSA